MTLNVIVGGGVDATVMLDPDTQVVCKRFRVDDPGLAADLVSREFHRLTVLHASLRVLPHVTCPRPLGMDPAAGELRMTFFEGERLDQLLASPAMHINTHLDHIGQQIALGLQRYIAELGEPYLDLGTYNTLYNLESQTVCLLDLTDPPTFKGRNTGEARAEASIGNFIGLSLYYTVARRTCLNHLYWKRIASIAVNAIRHIDKRDSLSISEIRRFSDHAYTYARSGGGTKHRFWHAAVGQHFYRTHLNAIIDAVTSGEDFSL